MAKLILLFTIVPLLELTLLLQLGDWMGLGPTVMLVLFTGVLGAALARREGGRVLEEWRGAINGQSGPPSDGVLEGVLILVGGVLLVTPGVLTDVSGMSLLFPPTRKLWAKAVRRWLDKKIAEGQVVMMHQTSVGGVTSVHTSGGAPRRGPGGVIEVDGVELPPEDSAQLGG